MVFSVVLDLEFDICSLKVTLNIRHDSEPWCKSYRTSRSHSTYGMIVSHDANQTWHHVTQKRYLYIKRIMRLSIRNNRQPTRSLYYIRCNGSTFDLYLWYGLPRQWPSKISYLCYLHIRSYIVLRYHTQLSPYKVIYSFARLMTPVASSDMWKCLYMCE